VKRGRCDHGTHAFVADGQSGLQIIDVTVPSSPSLSATSIPGTASGLALWESYLLLADRPAIRLIDVLDPALPAEVGVWNTPATRST